MTDSAENRRHLTPRRPLLKVAGGAVALGAVGVTSRVVLHPGSGSNGGDGGPALVLATHDKSDMRALDLRLGDGVLPEVSRGRWRSRQLPTSTHSMVAFTWDRGSRAPTLRIRSRINGLWQPWVPVPLLHDEPDPGSEERTATTGTDLMWIGAADGIQIDVQGARPDNLTLVLLHPSRRVSDGLVDAPARLSSRAPSSRRRIAEPEMFTRADWGADESWRDGQPTYNPTLKQVHVHHTVNSNGYARRDVPGLIRGMYRYHTQNLGWSDIGYNFLVDRFGRIWVGRAGGASRLVRGAHTRGFNGESTGVSVIGNYDLAAPGKATLKAIAVLAAWKLQPYGRNPRGRVRVRSEGSDKYRAGTTVRLRVIDGHRDTNDTACPGDKLYAALPKIRRKAARILRRHEQETIRVDEPAAIRGRPVLGEKLVVDVGVFRPADANIAYLWTRDGRRIRGARERVYPIRARDVGHRVSCRVKLSKRGYAQATQTPAADGPARASSEIDIRLNKRAGRVAVDVRVLRPEGVRVVPTGTVTVRVDERSKVVKLVDGRGRARFGWHRRLRDGRHSLSASYGGDRNFLRAPRVDRTVRID